MAPKSVDEGWVTVRIPRRTHERLESLYAEVETGGLRLLGRELEFYADGEKRELGARNSRGLLLHVAVEALERARRAGASRADDVEAHERAAPVAVTGGFALTNIAPPTDNDVTRDHATSLASSQNTWKRPYAADDASSESPAIARELAEAAIRVEAAEKRAAKRTTKKAK